jgi:hypothetical protein
MVCRGFTGELRAPRELRFRARDGVFLGASALALGALRWFDVPVWLGQTALELCR